MIIDSSNSGLSSNLPQNGGAFTIAATAQAFQILSSGVYEHKIAAVVREYMTNALDAHVQAGKEDVPFRVVLPTTIHPYFEVEDFGIGMDMDAAVRIYTQYFTSTKSGTNEVAGGFGLGGKSFLAYTKQFTVRFRKNGIEHTALIYIDQNSCPRIDIISTCKTTESDGVKISIPVKQSDFYQFEYEARFYASFYKVKPIFNVDVEPYYENSLFHNDDEDVVFVSGVRPYSALGSYSLYVLIGPVPYPVQPQSLDGLMSSDVEFFNNYKGRSEHAKTFVKMPIGSLAIAASRESLSLDSKSEEVLVEKLLQIIESSKRKVFEYVTASTDHPITVIATLDEKFPNPILQSYALSNPDTIVGRYNSGHFRIPNLRTVKIKGSGTRKKYTFIPTTSSYADSVMNHNMLTRGKPKKELKVLEYDKDVRRINQILDSQKFDFVYCKKLTSSRKARIEKILDATVSVVSYTDLYKSYNAEKRKETVRVSGPRNRYTAVEVVASGEVVSKYGTAKFTNKATDISVKNVYWVDGEVMDSVCSAVLTCLKFVNTDDKVTLIRMNKKTEKKLTANGIVSAKEFLSKFEKKHFDELKWAFLSMESRISYDYIPFVLADSKIVSKSFKEVYMKMIEFKKHINAVTIKASGTYMFPKIRSWVADTIRNLDSELSAVREEYSALDNKIRCEYPLINELGSTGVVRVVNDNHAMNTLTNYVKLIEGSV